MSEVCGVAVGLHSFTYFLPGSTNTYSPMFPVDIDQTDEVLHSSLRLNPFHCSNSVQISWNLMNMAVLPLIQGSLRSKCHPANGSGVGVGGYCWIIVSRFT